MLQELEAELLKQGYSRRYVDRLTNELYDHYLESTEDKACEDCFAIDKEAALGTVEVLTGTVQRFGELDPVPRKFPFVFFVFLPAVVLNLLLLSVLYFVYEWIPPVDQEKKFWAIHSWNTAYSVLVCVLPLVGLFFATKYRVSNSFVFLLTVVLLASSFFGISVATCSQSNSVFVHSSFQFRMILFVLPLFIFGGRFDLEWLLERK